MFDKRTLVIPKSTHYYLYLDDSEKRFLLDKCKTLELYNEYLIKKLAEKGKIIDSVKQSIQMKDMAGNWMNVFKIFW